MKLAENLNALEKIATIVSGLLGGYWLIVAIGATPMRDQVLSFTILWLLIVAVLRLLK